MCDTNIDVFLLAPARRWNLSAIIIRNRESIQKDKVAIFQLLWIGPSGGNTGRAYPSLGFK